MVIIQKVNVGVRVVSGSVLQGACRSSIGGSWQCRQERLWAISI